MGGQMPPLAPSWLRLCPSVMVQCATDYATAASSLAIDSLLLYLIYLFIYLMLYGEK